MKQTALLSAFPQPRIINSRNKKIISLVIVKNVVVKLSNLKLENYIYTNLILVP